MKLTGILLTILLATSPAAWASARLKDLVTIEGVRGNPLVGYGLVVGLNGTGDKRQTVFSAQSLTNLLTRMGVSVSPSAMLVRNMASVLVTADLPAFAQPGARIDITVAAIGDASNLQGGLLILTSLRGSDGQTYAVAQGSVVTGGFSAGKGGSTQTTNHPTAGRVPEGATVERIAPSVAPGDHIKLQLRQADFTTAMRISQAINHRFPATSDGLPVANPDNPGLVVVNTPALYHSRTVELLSEIENLSVDADTPARIIVNERTGTIVMGKDVRILPVSILHGSLTVEVKTSLLVSQPEPLSQGKTTVVPDVAVTAKEEKARNLVLPQGATVEELVRGLMTIGSTPRDIIAILQSLRAAGALQAELEVI